jgi:hypothetical protein
MNLSPVIATIPESVLVSNISTSVPAPGVKGVAECDFDDCQVCWGFGSGNDGDPCPRCQGTGRA